jgi:predicted phage tail protein
MGSIREKDPVRSEIYTVIRNIKLHGSLAKAAGVSDFRLDVNTQHELFLALKAQGPDVDMAMRRAGAVHIVQTGDNDENPAAVEDGFQFSSKAKNLHVAASTEGAWNFVIYAVIALVVSYVTTKLMTHLQTNSNGSGGAKDTMFNGPANTTDQGGPIPIIYGKKVLVGSTIISSDEDYYNIV